MFTFPHIVNNGCREMIWGKTGLIKMVKITNCLILFSFPSVVDRLAIFKLDQSTC